MLNKLYSIILLLFAFGISQATIVTVTASGLTYSPSTINIFAGDTINFSIGGSHDVVQITTAGGCTATSGGFTLPFGGGLLLPTTAIGSVGTYFIKCTPHCGMGMRATINVTAPPSPGPGLSSFSSVGTALCETFTGFNASGFSPTPIAGQLNSNSWSMTDWSTGILYFGGTRTTASTDYTRGLTSWGTPVTGGVYSITANNNLMIQPTTSDMDNGTITYRIKNTTGSALNTFNVSYDIFYLNDQTRNTDITLAYATDTNSVWQVPTTKLSTGLLPTTSTLDSITKTVTLTGFSVPNNEYIYLRWIVRYNSGSGSSDEFAIDNICVTPNTTGTTSVSRLNEVVLNEFLTNNISSSVTSPSGLRSDYIELFNRTSSSIDISGFSLSNSNTNKYLYTFPTGTTLPASGYLIAWCDTNISGAGIHTNFTLNNVVGNIYLSNFLGRQLDSAIYSGGVADTTFSRIPNGTGAFRNYSRLTPLAVNDTFAVSIIPVVRFSSATSSVNEGTATATITVNLSSPNSSPTSVDVMLGTGSTATGGGTDYTFTTSTVTFPASSTTPQTVTVSINNDLIAESNETVVLKLANPTNSAIFGTDSIHTLTIVDNDQLRVDWDTTTFSYNENAGTVSANVVINTSSPSPTSVNVSLISGTATSGSDFNFTPITVTFPASSTAPQSVTFSIIDDSSPESTENFTLRLSGATNSAVVTDSNFVVNIIDNDAPSSGDCANLFFSEYIEGSSNNKSVEIYNPTSSAINLSTYSLVKYINGSATPSGTRVLSGTIAPGDVYVISNNNSNTVIILASDDTTGFMNFNGNDALELKQLGTSLDIIGQIGVDPGAGGFSVNGGTTTDRTIIRSKYSYKGNTNWTTASLEWNAFPIDMTDSIGAHNIMPCGSTVPPTISFDTMSMTVNEGVGSVGFGFRVNNPSGTAFSVDVLVDVSSSTATGADYTFAPRTVNFPGGTTQTLVIINDLLVEGAENIKVKMRNPTAGALIVDSIVTINIVDNDSLKVFFEGAGASVVETTPSTVINVKLSGTTTSSVSVDVRYLSGDATIGVDFTFTDTTLTFLPGDTQKSVRVNIIDDLADEVNEQAILTLTNATGGATYGTRNHTVVIVDNDSIGISVNDPKNSLNINMYPNPVLNNLIIESNESSINNISIMDALGKVIRFESNFSNPKNVLLVCNNLSSGIYYIQIKSEDRIFNKLFIKE
jgi:plastocyanin